MNNILEIGINAPYDLKGFNALKTENDIKNLNKILDGNNILNISSIDLKDNDKYDVIIINEELNSTVLKKDNDKCILNISRANSGDIKVTTGNYIGILCFKNGIIKINSGYSSFFTKRMLNFSNNIYVENSLDSGSSEEDDLLILLQYLFLSTLKRASILGLPKKYTNVKKQDFCIKGKIDFKRYIKNLKNIHCGIPYNYKKRSYCQEIVDVIYCAMRLCNPNYFSKNFSELLPIMKELKQFYSGAIPTASTINKSKTSSVLNNEMYSLYKKVLLYAEILLLKKGFTPFDNKKYSVKGWLIDVYELWEIYLFHVLKKEFPDWTIIYQEEIPFYYGKTFFGRKFKPDIIMHKGNEIIIVDAKFKKMDFVNGDVDRSDLQQIHTYYGYYLSSNYDVKLATLVYPARNDIPPQQNSFEAIFNGGSKTKFGVSYIKIGDSINEQLINEKLFAERLSKIIVS